MPNRKKIQKFILAIFVVGTLATIIGFYLESKTMNNKTVTNTESNKIVVDQPAEANEDYLQEEVMEEEPESSVDSYNDNELMIYQSDFGDGWPLTADSGVLKCESAPGNSQWSIITFHTENTVYAVNGLARGARAEQNGWVDIEKIWKSDPENPTFKINISPLIDRGLAICNGE